MALTEEEWTAIRDSYLNPNGIWRSAGYDAHDKVWFMIDQATRTYRKETEAFVKAEYLNYELRDIQLKEPWIENLRAWGITEPRVVEVPEYPKDITRGPYTIRVDNFVQEEQAKEFLGIEPPGDDLDTWLSKRDLAGLTEWKNYWTEIFTNVGMAFWIDFVNDKFEEYKAKLPPPVVPPTEEEEVYAGLEEEIEPITEADERPLFDAIKSFFAAIIKKDLKAALSSLVGILTRPIAEDLVMGQLPITPTGAFAITPEIAAKLGPKLTWFQKLSAFFVKYWKIISKWVIGTMSASTLIQFLYEETLQTQGIGVWAAISNKQWDIAYDALLKARERLEHATFVINWFGWTSPLTWDVFKQYTAATKDQFDIYEQVIIAKSGLLDNPSINGLIFDKEEFRRRLLAHEIPNIADLITKAMEEAIAVGTLIIRPTPSDAKVSVEGEIPTTGVFSKDLVPGTYGWTVSKYQYTSKSGIAEVTESTTTLLEGAEVTITELVEEELPPEEVMGKLTINAIDSEGSAEGIIIEVAGKPDIVMVGSYELSPGSYDVRASKPGFVTQTKKAFVSEEKDTVVSFILEKVEAPDELPTKATILITSEPTDSDIYINGEYTFTKTPYTTVLDAGTYIIRVQRDGYYPQEASVTFGEGEEMTVPFLLQELPPEVIPTITYTPYEPWIPDYQPATYYTPAVQPTPYSQISLPDYSLISTPTFTPILEPIYPAVVEKEIMINIETTDVKPWKGKIFSIAWKDLTTPGAETQVIVDEDEKGILEGFLHEFNVGNYKTIIGYNLKFDYQWIFNKLMLYRIPANKFYQAELRDVYQLMSQVKEEFVYNARAYGKLDDYAKELLGIGKLGTQETLLRRYTAGDLAYVEQFQLRQIEITNGLYQLFRYSASESVIPPIPSTPEEIPLSAIPSGPESPVQTGQKQCLNCKAFNPIENKECFICHQALGP